MAVSCGFQKKRSLSVFLWLIKYPSFWYNNLETLIFQEREKLSAVAGEFFSKSNEGRACV